MRKMLLVAMLVTGCSHGGGILGYFGKYKLGFDYTRTSDDVDVSYEVKRGATVPSHCDEPTRPDADSLRCHTDVAAGGSSGFGLFLQQPFKRQGDFHFDYDVGFGVRYLAGTMTKEERAKIAAEGLPLDQLSFGLGALIVKPYIQLGYTPQSSFPDLLLSVGPTLEAAGGWVSVNGERRRAFVGATSHLTGYTELEIVFARFGNGAFSIFSSRDISTSRKGSSFFRGEVDGMSNFESSFHHGVGGAAFGYGLKLLLNWP